MRAFSLRCGCRSVGIHRSTFEEGEESEVSEKSEEGEKGGKSEEGEKSEDGEKGENCEENAVLVSTHLFCTIVARSFCFFTCLYL